MTEDPKNPKRPPKGLLPIEEYAGKAKKEFIGKTAELLAEDAKGFTVGVKKQLEKQRLEKLDQALRHIDQMSYEQLVREGERDLYTNYEHRRRHLGYALGGISISGMVALIVFAFWSLHRLIEPPKDVLGERFVWVVVAGHSVVTVAAAFFAYQMLKAAERLIFPAWWAKSSRKLMAAMLGIKDPLSASAKTVQQLIKLVEKLISKVDAK
jgi:hypothetical protein